VRKNEVPASRYGGGIFCWRSLQLPRPNRLDSNVPPGLAQTCGFRTVVDDNHLVKTSTTSSILQSVRSCSYSLNVSNA